MPLSSISVVNNRVPDFAHIDDRKLCLFHLINLKLDYGTPINGNRVILFKLASMIFRAPIYFKGFNDNGYAHAYFPKGIPDWFSGFGKCPVISEFENAFCFGTIRDAFYMRGFTARSDRKGKTQWGDLISVRPFENETPFHSTFVQYKLKPTSPIYQKQVTRNEYKALLRRYNIPLSMVSNAISIGWKEAWDRKKEIKKPGYEALYRDQEKLIAGIFGIDLKTFWRNCRNGNYEHVAALARSRKLAPERLVPGYTKYPRPQEPQQLELFEMTE